MVDYTKRRSSQVVRQWSATPVCTGSNPVCAFEKALFERAFSFYLFLPVLYAFSGACNRSSPISSTAPAAAQPHQQRSPGSSAAPSAVQPRQQRSPISSAAPSAAQPGSSTAPSAAQPRQQRSPISSAAPTAAQPGSSAAGQQTRKSQQG